MIDIDKITPEIIEALKPLDPDKYFKKWKGSLCQIELMQKSG